MRLSDADMEDCLSRKFSIDGNCTDNTYVRVVLLQWLNLPNEEALLKHAAGLREEEIHKDDKDLLKEFFVLHRRLFARKKECDG